MNAREEAVKVGADALVGGFRTNAEDAERVLDAAHRAGLISYQDEWEEFPRYDVTPDGAPVFVRRPVEE